MYLVPLMAIKVYCERNATRPWLTELERQRKIVLVQFPYDGHNRRVRQRATPSVVTVDSTYVTCDMTIPISDMVEYERCEQIRRIIGRKTRATPGTLTAVQVRLRRLPHYGQGRHPAERGGA